MDESYLMHYGIPNMKWGVRRFQEKGSSKRTPEGKKRYAHRVTSKALAERLYEKASRSEPKITKVVTEAVKSTGAKMYGLKNRLKTKESLARKIDSEAKSRGISIIDAAKSIKDSVRYTSVSDDSDFTKNYFTVKENLRNQGYIEIRCRNYFDLYRKGEANHKQITSVYSDKAGHQFELQFQTPSSIKAKELKTPLYEEVRQTDVTKKREQNIIKQMKTLAKQVTNPEGVYTIKSHG